ncbi:hypothetical protein An11g06910 [Aspergillus niger]|uniref:Uncharacterized protein n=2 Tax=Aspergillus niger TaxID=5061 RepID=A2QWY6_ASPNC|nr:hypothetical protein An11g06910 [Aspergillus niger]CAK96988.1 hypothetical protein An11g06910 [Aspergillus niger]
MSGATLGRNRADRRKRCKRKREEVSKAGEREGVAGLEGSGRVDEAGGLGVVTGSASTQSFGAYQSMFQSAGPGVTATRCPKINLAGREWMIVANGSPSGTPGNNTDLNKSLVQCRLTKSQDNASVPNNVDKGPMLCMHHRYLMALESKSQWVFLGWHLTDEHTSEAIKYPDWLAIAPAYHVPWQP